MHFVRAGFRFIHLINEDDRPQPEAQSLANHEFRLRHRSFSCIDQYNNAVDHAENAFNLAAEIRMSRRVDYIDAHALPIDRGAFRQDRNPAFALLIVAVHCALSHALIVSNVSTLL